MSEKLYQVFLQFHNVFEVLPEATGGWFFGRKALGVTTLDFQGLGIGDFGSLGFALNPKHEHGNWPKAPGIHRRLASGFWA